LSPLTPTAPDVSPPLPAAVAGYPVTTDSMQFDNKMYLNAEEPPAINNGLADSTRNIYETVQDVPTATPFTYEHLSTSKPSQLASPPDAASSLSSTAAAAVYDVIKDDDVDFTATNDSGNVYDTIDDAVTTASQTSSPPTSPQRSPTDTDSVYLYVPARSSSTSTPSEPTSPAEPPTAVAAAASFYQPMTGQPHLEISSASPSPLSTSQPTLLSESPPEPDNTYLETGNSTNDVPTARTLQTPPEVDNYIHPVNTNEDVPCAYAELTNNDYANVRKTADIDSVKD